MTFVDYAIILKGNCKRRISNENLCEMLFDAIIKPLDLRNRKGEILSFDKADISKIMNRKKNIPNILHENVYRKVVQESIVEYFEMKIVPELFDDTSDLIYQMMNRIEKDKNISPAHKEKLRLSANKDSVSLFLAEAFVYVMGQKNKSAKTNQSVKAEMKKPVVLVPPQYNEHSYRIAQETINTLNQPPIKSLLDMMKNFPFQMTYY